MAKNIKVAVALQKYEGVDDLSREIYNKASVFILEIPKDQVGVVQHLDSIFNTVNRLYSEILNLYSYSEGIEKRCVEHIHDRFDSMGFVDNYATRLLRKTGYERVKGVAQRVMRTNEKRLYLIVCELFGWNIVTQLPCVIDNVATITIS